MTKMGVGEERGRRGEAREHAHMCWTVSNGEIWKSRNGEDKINPPSLPPSQTVEDFQCAVLKDSLATWSQAVCQWISQAVMMILQSYRLHWEFGSKQNKIKQNKIKQKCFASEAWRPLVKRQIPLLWRSSELPSQSSL